MRSALVFLLGMLLSSAAPAAAKPSAGRLLKLLPEAQGDGELRVIRALGRSARPKEAVPALLPLFDARKDSPRRSAVIAEALGRLGDERAAGPLLGAWDYLVSLRQQMDLTAQVQVLRLAVIEALGGVGGKDAGRAMTEALSDPDPVVVAAAARALGAMRERGAVEALAQLLDKEGGVGQAACEALGAIGDAKGAPALERALSVPTAAAAAPAAYGLARLGRKEGVKTLQSILDGSLTGEPGAVLAAYYLTKLDKNSGLEFLVQLLESEMSGLPVRAAEALGKSGNARAVLPLTEAIPEAAPELRLTIAQSLGRLGGTRATVALKKLGKDEKTEVRAAAAAALEELGED
ncbi:MAG: HEAT repeat domain-containing protein [Elusimicrobia bacterium]|nr:HEAT repeat domain-containing protein [Elusimicrobiota bacterium]